MARMQLDTLVGMGFSNIVALFIMLTTAATLNAHGITDIETSLAGRRGAAPDRRAFRVRGVRARHHRHRPAGPAGPGRQRRLRGRRGAAAGASGWRSAPAARRRSTARSRPRPSSARLLNFTPLDPIKALFWSAVINGVVAVPIMAMIMLMGTRRNVMGQFTLSPILTGLGWLATAVMAPRRSGCLRPGEINKEQNFFLKKEAKTFVNFIPGSARDASSFDPVAGSCNRRRHPTI